MFVGPFAVTVRTNDIALARLFEQFLRIDTAEHSRHFKRFVNWTSMVEVHREKGKRCRQSAQGTSRNWRSN
jgi:hypothetical protein